MTLFQTPKTCYEIYHCESCGEVCVIENPYYYPNYFEIIEFPEAYLFKLGADFLKSPIKFIRNMVGGGKVKLPKKEVYIEHFSGICEKCLKSKDPKSIRSTQNPIDIYRISKEEYRGIVTSVLKKEMEKFKRELPQDVLKELNPDAYMRLANPENCVEEKRQRAKEYVELTKREIISYLKGITMENEEVVKKKNEVLIKEKEVVEFLRNFDGKIIRYSEVGLNPFYGNKRILELDNYTFMGEIVTKEKMYVEVEHYNKNSILKKIEQGRAFDVFSGVEERFEAWFRDLPVKLAKKIYIEE